MASLCEIAIKTRSGKLEPGMGLADLASFFDAIGLRLLPIDRTHVVADLVIEPETRDPFDRLLLAQCQVESLRLVTVDRALGRHPSVLVSF